MHAPNQGTRWILARISHSPVEPIAILGTFATHVEAQWAAEDDAVLSQIDRWTPTMYRHAWPAYIAIANTPNGQVTGWAIEVSPELATMAEFSGELPGGG